MLLNLYLRCGVEGESSKVVCDFELSWERMKCGVKRMGGECV